MVARTEPARPRVWTATLGEAETMVAAAICEHGGNSVNMVPANIRILIICWLIHADIPVYNGKVFEKKRIL